jgi:DHA3 family macrolide efflux protein-like MFS transporter
LAGLLLGGHKKPPFSFYYREVTQIKKFAVFWTSQAFSLVGSAVVEFALAWYLTRETGRATVLATALLVALLPGIVLGPFIGPLVDRWNRKKIMIFSDLFTALLTVGLVVLFFTGAIQIWHIYVAMVGRAVGQAFQYPAMQASVANIVPEKHLSRAAGLTQTLHGIINIAAPPAGAFLMEALPMQQVLAVDIVTAVLAVSCLLFIGIPQPVRTSLSVKLNIIGDMLQAFRYIWTTFGIKIMVLMVSIYCFFATPAYNLFPMLVNKHLGGDVIKLGWLNSLFGVGMIVGGLVLGTWGGFKKRILTSASGSTLQGILLIGLGFTTIKLFPFVMVFNFMLGIGVAFASAPLSAILNSVVAKDMQGRVFSLMGSISSAMVPLGLAVAGPVADAFGVKVIYFIAGTALLLSMPMGLLSKSQRDYEK